jgi:uncharacterized protein YoxC
MRPPDWTIAIELAAALVTLLGIGWRITHRISTVMQDVSRFIAESTRSLQSISRRLDKLTDKVDKL